MMGDEELPTMECPDCGDEQADYDGFGVLHCFKCGFCTHAAITGGVCELCGKAAKTTGDETADRSGTMIGRFTTEDGDFYADPEGEMCLYADYQKLESKLGEREKEIQGWIERSAGLSSRLDTAEKEREQYRQETLCWPGDLTDEVRALRSKLQESLKAEAQLQEALSRETLRLAELQKVYDECYQCSVEETVRANEAESRLSWRRLGDARPTEPGFYALRHVVPDDFLRDIKRYELGQVVSLETIQKSHYHDEWRWLGPLPDSHAVVEKHRSIGPRKQVVCSKCGSDVTYWLSPCASLDCPGPFDKQQEAP